MRMLLSFIVSREPVLVLRPENAEPGIRIELIAATNPVPMRNDWGVMLSVARRWS